VLGLADFDAILLRMEVLYDQFTRSVLADIARRLLKTFSPHAWEWTRKVSLDYYRYGEDQSSFGERKQTEPF